MTQVIQKIKNLYKVDDINGLQKVFFWFFLTMFAVTSLIFINLAI